MNPLYTINLAVKDDPYKTSDTTVKWNNTEHKFLDDAQLFSPTKPIHQPESTSKS